MEITCLFILMSHSASFNKWSWILILKYLQFSIESNRHIFSANQYSNFQEVLEFRPKILIPIPYEPNFSYCTNCNLALTSFFCLVNAFLRIKTCAERSGPCHLCCKENRSIIGFENFLGIPIRPLEWKYRRCR